MSKAITIRIPPEVAAWLQTLDTKTTSEAAAKFIIEAYEQANSAKASQGTWGGNRKHTASLDVVGNRKKGWRIVKAKPATKGLTKSQAYFMLESYRLLAGLPAVIV